MLYEYECQKCSKRIIMKRFVSERDIPVYCTCSVDQEKKDRLENPHTIMIRNVFQQFSTQGLDHNVT